MLLAIMDVSARATSLAEPGVVAKRLELAAEVMRTDTGLHANQAQRRIGQPRFDLTSRPLDATQ